MEGTAFWAGLVDSVNYLKGADQLLAEELS